MNELISPGSLITIAGGVLTVVGALAYGAGNAPPRHAPLFGAVPVLLGGRARQTAEVPPGRRVRPEGNVSEARSPASPELVTLLNGGWLWCEGQKAHLESSLEALKLWDEDKPSQLLEIEELSNEDGYGLRMRFACEAVGLERWQERRERLGRFFAKGLEAQILPLENDQLDLTLLPKSDSTTGEHGEP